MSLEKAYSCLEKFTNEKLTNSDLEQLFFLLSSHNKVPLHYLWRCDCLLSTLYLMTYFHNNDKSIAVGVIYKALRLLDVEQLVEELESYLPNISNLTSVDISQRRVHQWERIRDTSEEEEESIRTHLRELLINHENRQSELLLNHENRKNNVRYGMSIYQLILAVEEIFNMEELHSKGFEDLFQPNELDYHRESSNSTTSSILDVIALSGISRIEYQKALAHCENSDTAFSFKVFSCCVQNPNFVEINPCGQMQAFDLKWMQDHFGKDCCEELQSVPLTHITNMIKYTNEDSQMSYVFIIFIHIMDNSDFDFVTFCNDLCPCEDNQPVSSCSKKTKIIHLIHHRSMLDSSPIQLAYSETNTKYEEATSMKLWLRSRNALFPMDQCVVTLGSCECESYSSPFVDHYKQVVGQIVDVNKEKVNVNAYVKILKTFPDMIMVLG